ncbi:MAG: S26 family signal peptidase [Bacteroidota bacterium]
MTSPSIFKMGDNRHNSHDSRAWGFVPMDHVVGKALFTWFSLEDGPFIKLFSRIRWNRILREIE